MKPILFNTEMVRAILDGRKTVTRRVIKFPPGMTGRLPSDGSRDYLFYPGGIKYPPYGPGDILYVRETFWRCIDGEYLYKADFSLTEARNRVWRPSIHMPKEAARLFLRVTNVRVERLRDITANQAMDEGFTDWTDFTRCWDSTIKETDLDKYGWAGNPWVWVIEFEKISKEEAHD